MRPVALPAPQPLDYKVSKYGKKLDLAQVMAIPYQASPLLAGAFQLVDRESFQHIVIRILRKVIEIFEIYRYHNSVFQKGDCSFVK